LAETPKYHNTHFVKANQVRAWAGEAFWLGFGLMTGMIALFVGTRFLTHLMSTGEYGRLALAVSLSTLAVLIFGDPVGRTAVRFYSLWCRAGKPRGFMQNLGKSLVRSMGGISLACVIAMVYSHNFHEVTSTYLILTTGIFAAILVCNRVAVALEDAARERRFRGVLQGGFEMLRFAFAIALITIFTLPAAETVLIGFVLAGILVVTGHAIFLYRLFHREQAGINVPGHPEGKMDVARMRSFQTPLVMNSICVWLVMMTERWTLQYFGSQQDVGGYAAVYQLAFIPMLLVSNFMVLLIEPILYQVVEPGGKTASSTQRQQINNYAVLWIMIFSVFVSVLLFFTYPAVGTLLLGVDFRGYSWMFPWLFLAGGCFAAARQLLLQFSYDMRTDLLAKIWGVVAAAAVTAYTAGAFYWQVKGLLAAVVGVNMALLLFSMICVNKHHAAKNVENETRQKMTSGG
jgi:O-antigen/teichoic acid export membrane protein